MDVMANMDTKNTHCGIIESVVSQDDGTNFIK